MEVAAGIDVATVTCYVSDVVFQPRASLSDGGVETDVQVLCSVERPVCSEEVRADVYLWPLGWVASGGLSLHMGVADVAPVEGSLEGGTLVSIAVEEESVVWGVGVQVW